MIIGQEEKPPLNELAHFGIKGMKWGQRKPEDPPTPRVDSVAKTAATIGGIQATRVILKRYGHYAVPVGKTGVKMAGRGAKYLLKNSGKTAKGAVSVAKILGTSGKVAVKGGKIYLKGTGQIVKAGFALTRALRK